MRIKHLVILFFVAGCGSNPIKQHTEILANAVPCCKTVSELAKIKLHTDKPLKMDFSDRDSVFLFESGKSFAKAFELVSPINTLAVNIQTEPSGSSYTPNAYWFYPVISFYDQNFNFISSFSNGQLVTRGNGYFTNKVILESYGFVGSLAKYVVVHTSDLALKHGVSFAGRSSSVIMIGNAPAAMNSDYSFITPFSPFGSVVITAVSKEKRIPDDYERKPPFTGVIVKLQ